MHVSGSNTKLLRGVGDVVDVVRGDGEVLGGTIVEDYAESLIAPKDLGRDWAHARRWAIVLESGLLVFVDDVDIVDDADADAEVSGDTGSGVGAR